MSRFTQRFGQLRTSKNHIVLFFVLISFNICAATRADYTDKQHSSRTLRIMARMYIAHGDYAKAQPLAERALNLARKNNVSNDELSLCLNDLAYLYKEQHRLDEAETLCRDGLRIQEKLQYANHPYIAQTLRTLSSIYRLQKKYHQARAAIERAISIADSNPAGPADIIVGLKTELAELLFAQGDLEQAQEYYLQALASVKADYGPNHLYTAQILTRTAETYTQQKKFAEAEPLIDQALAIYEKLYGPEHPLLVSLSITKTNISAEKNRRDEVDDIALSREELLSLLLEP